jgi:hypothetical protein
LDILNSSLNTSRTYAAAQARPIFRFVTTLNQHRWVGVGVVTKKESRKAVLFAAANTKHQLEKSFFMRPERLLEQCSHREHCCEHCFLYF